jgi:HD-GYP domain-containing protein (c-di-GMP phosphodiesterase class II)
VLPFPRMDTSALTRRLAKLQRIVEVAKAMTAERQLRRLLGLIIDAAAGVAEADRCSIFVVDRERHQLWTPVAHGTGEIRLSLDAGVVGAVARAGRPERIPDAYADPRFSREVDASTGYRTRDLLCVPMLNTAGEVVGVIQALNRREGTFNDEDQELLEALAGPAASAIENAVLHEEIERLFEGFVRASVTAIESRDPTTAGHSERVATFTVARARAVEQAPPAAWRGVRFDAASLQQLRYAALLHDFGKVGVREQVLVKADKLYPHQLELLVSRFELARAALQVERLAARLAGADEAGLAERERELDGVWEVIQLANRPTVLPEAAGARLRELAGLRFAMPGGAARPLVTEDELRLLSIEKGSLSLEERREIESHVTHTYRFLSQIPWTRTLRRVPEIAHGHHEKLDGRGYPRAVPGGEIAVETRMMTIADIYDALTASDRPYKKALPAERALDILGDEARRGQIDAPLLSVFVEAGLWKAPAR